MDKVAVAGALLSYKCKSTLSRLGYRIIVLPPYKKLPGSTASHPDMLVFFCGDILLCCEDYYSNYGKNEIDLIMSLCPTLRLWLTDEAVTEKYPGDILLNAATIGDTIFGLVPHISSKIIKYAKDNGMHAVNVRQGYAKCSTCIVSQKAVITSDNTIAYAARENGIDALLIRPGHIVLEGVSYGFIGGACGCDDENVYFCGDITAHPDFGIINDFCKKHGKNPVSLSDEPLTDTGSLFFI